MFFFVFNGRVIFYKAVSHNVWRCHCCLLSNVCTHVGGEWIYCGMKESEKGRMMMVGVEKRVCSLFCSQSIVHSLTTWINISTRTQHPRCLWNLQIMLGALMSSHQGEDYLVENFSATSGGKFSESTKNQIFGANMCKTLI